MDPEPFTNIVLTAKFWNYEGSKQCLYDKPDPTKWLNGCLQG